MLSASSNNSITTAIVKTGAKDSIERRCENPDCGIYKLVSMVPKRKTAQFVTEPCVIDKPMLVNGFTTIFQVDGVAAKISDIRGRGTAEPRKIFRIMPNTHAHVSNYVVVDQDGDSLRKINTGDPATMKRLLDSQRASAEQILNKLMSAHGNYMQVSNATISNGVSKVTLRKPLLPTTTTTTAATLPTLPTLPTMPTLPTLPTLPTIPSTTKANTTPISNALGVLSKIPSATSAKLPMRSVTITKVGPPTTLPTMTTTLTTMTTTTTPTPAQSQASNIIRLNSNIKVRPLVQKSGASTPSSTLPTTRTTTTKPRNSTPLIKTVPLAQLQEPAAVPVLRKPELTPTPVVSSNVPPPADKSLFEKMQKELEELRRTVAILAESQQKNELNSGTPQNKKPRMDLP